MDEPEYLSSDEAAKFLGIKKNYLRQLTRRKLLKVEFKSNRVVFYDKLLVEKYAKTRRPPTPTRDNFGK
jgi:hypothetical protein